VGALGYGVVNANATTIDLHAGTGVLGHTGILEILKVDEAEAPRTMGLYGKRFIRGLQKYIGLCWQS